MTISSKKRYSWKSSGLDNLLINILNLSIGFQIIGFLIFLFSSNSIDYYVMDKYNYFITVFTLISHITMLSWLYKTAKISHKYGKLPMQFKEFHSVIYWFVPIMNLYKPFQVMKEVWEVSFGQNVLDSSDDELASFTSWKFSYQFNIMVLACIAISIRFISFENVYESRVYGLMIAFIPACTAILWDYSTREFVKTLSEQQKLKWSLS